MRGLVTPGTDRPVELTTLLTAPRVFRVSKFLADEEIDQMLAHVVSPDNP